MPSSQSSRGVLVDAFTGLTADERQLLTCALAGNHPDSLAPLRMEVLRSLAIADRNSRGAGPKRSRSVLLHVALCSRCGGEPDADGAEWAPTAAAAARAAVMEANFRRTEGGDVLCENCWTADEEAHDAAA